MHFLKYYVTPFLPRFWLRRHFSLLLLTIRLCWASQHAHFHVHTRARKHTNSAFAHWVIAVLLCRFSVSPTVSQFYYMFVKAAILTKREGSVCTYASLHKQGILCVYLSFAACVYKHTYPERAQTMLQWLILSQNILLHKIQTWQVKIFILLQDTSQKWAFCQLSW